MKKIMPVLGAILLAATTSVSFAVPVTFSDTKNYWPGWGNTTADDGTDVIGTPDITGGVADFVNGILKSVHINYTNINEFSSLTAGDLFIVRSEVKTTAFRRSDLSLKPFAKHMGRDGVSLR